MGLWKTTTFGSNDSSRASTTFWMFPPDSVPARVRTEGVRMSNASTRRRASALIVLCTIAPKRKYGFSPIRLMKRLIATLNEATTPSPRRSSVTYRRPSFSRAATPSRPIGGVVQLDRARGRAALSG